MKKIFLIILTSFLFSSSLALAEEKLVIEPYEKVLSKFRKLPDKKKLPFIATLKIHSAIQLGDLAVKKVDNKNEQDHILFTRLGIESNNNLIDFARTTKDNKFIALFKAENEMLEKRMSDKVSNDDFKKKQKKLFKETHILLKKITEEKGFKDLVTSSKDEISYFHKNQFMSALRRAVNSMKKQ